MKAFSCNQPYAELLITGEHTACGKYHGTDYRGPALLHTTKTRVGLQWTEDDFYDYFGLPMPNPATLIFGACIAIVDIVGCVPQSSMPLHRFSRDRWMWQVANPRRIQPIYCPGTGTLWDIAAEPVILTAG